MIDRLALALCLALLFVWSLPGTMALRLVLLVAALALLARHLASTEFRSGLRGARLPLGLLAALTLWLLLQAVFVSPETDWALGELRGQWLPALLALLLGLLLGSRGRGVATAIVLVFAAQAAVAVIQAVWNWRETGILFTQMVPLTGGKLEMSFVLNLLLAFLAADAFCRAGGRAPLVALPVPAVAALAALALGASVLVGSRNGLITIALLVVLVLALFLFERRQRLGRPHVLGAALAVAAGLTVIATLGVRSDSRWQAFAETAAIGWDIDRHPAWFAPSEYPWPKLADGRDVDHSTYTRVAFVHGGLRLIAEQPLGHGYGRNAFAHALRQRHPVVELGHAHNGWIDLGVGGGVPALALWATFLGSLLWQGWRRLFDRSDPHGMLLLLVTAGYGGRMLLDSVNKDHMLQMFLFLAGVLLVIASPPRQEGRR